MVVALTKLLDPHLDSPIIKIIGRTTRYSLIGFYLVVALALSPVILIYYLTNPDPPEEGDSW